MSVSYSRLLEAAVEAFAARGYRRTGINDIARQAGIAPGTVYRYVKDKEGLFYLSLCLALLGDDTPPGDTPFRTPDPPQFALLVSAALEVIEEEKPVPELAHALSIPSGSASSESMRAELRDILMGIFRMSHAYSTAAQLIDGAAEEWPGLASHYHQVFGYSVATDAA